MGTDAATQQTGQLHQHLVLQPQSLLLQVVDPPPLPPGSDARLRPQGNLGSHWHCGHVQCLGHGHVLHHVHPDREDVGRVHPGILPPVVRVVGLDVSAPFNRLSDLPHPDTRRGDHDNSHAAENRSFGSLHRGLVVSLRHPGRRVSSSESSG